MGEKSECKQDTVLPIQTQNKIYLIKYQIYFIIYIQTHMQSALRTFAHKHDELPAFHAAYLVITVLIAALLNLGVFVFLIATHMALDYVKYREYHKYSLRQTLRGVMRESLFDITLLALATVITIYLHHSLSSIAGLSGLLRAEVTIARGLGTLIPKFEILHRFFHTIFHIGHHIRYMNISIEQSWTRGEKVEWLLIGISILNIELTLFQKMLMEEFFPWRM